MTINNSLENIPCWQRFEHTFSSAVTYANPLQEATFSATFVSPSGHAHTVDGFWDGHTTWRVRFAPDEIGEWNYNTACTDQTNEGLHAQSGKFTCSAPSGSTVFEQHGPLCLSANRHFLAHADGTPFFFMADTAWNGPLRSTPAEWDHYVQERSRQKFTAVQWVATQWFVSPDGDIDGNRTFTGKESIALNPAFFQRMDTRIETMKRAGLLSVPVLLWAARWSSAESNETNPGFALPEDQAIVLARYMVARWGADPVVWILPGDSDYRGEFAERWKRIGRAVFGDRPHAPVSLHPGGMHWNLDEFSDEQWLDIIGYQSGHGDDDPTLAWLVEGPPATTWTVEPHHPFINLEPPYENHLAYQSRQPHSAHNVRRGLYWSLLVSPTAGVTYGGHGIWGWDDGTQPPAGHPNTGIPLPWREALCMEGAEQVAHVNELFTSIEWWRLMPAQTLLAAQPGEHDKGRFITAARSEAGDLAVVYVPADRDVDLLLESLHNDLSATWFDPRTRSRVAAAPVATEEGTRFTTPGPGDWLLVFQADAVIASNEA